MRALTIRVPEGMGEVRPGDRLDALIADALTREGLQLAERDMVVCCQKIVSKAENRYVDLATVEPGPRALELAPRCRKDARLVELVLRESTEVVRCVPEVLIVRHRLGFVVANAGVDQSNLAGEGERALLLPENPDASAAALRAALQARFDVRIAVLISDSFGRPWRTGTCGVCIGVAGLNPLLDLRGQPDRAGRALRVTQIAAADQIAAAATQVMGESSEGTPVAIVSGVAPQYFAEPGPAAKLLRPLHQDLFR